jgi:type VI secretion system protein ImpL
MAALKYIFAALLIAAVWTVVLLLEFPLWIAIVATVVILLVLGLVVLLKVLRARKAAREIERALQAQAAAHAASARPDLRADVEAMQNEFLKAVQALKASKLGGKRPTEALYALPWYMIIGPPGAGKSTALRNSGLRFPYLSKSGGGVQGVGGTRNCQWWMTNEAVILDTAGRYTTEDADREEWLSFLDLLKKNRSKAPINGVLVAIAVTDLVDAHPEEALARAREVRARIDEVMAKLEMVVPVYVLFTKCDLLPGFVELFGDLGQKERSQIWGFTVPVSQRKSDPAALFAEHFNTLAATIERHALRRMSDERRAEARDKIYEFPQYFEPMRDNLAMFVGELMAESIYTESPIMRGAYFTSGTQEGRPIDRIMQSMASAFGIAPKMSHTEPQVEAKSYFLGDVFSKVIFPDKRIAQRSAARLRKQAVIRHSIAAGLFLFGVGLAVLPVASFQNNRELLDRSGSAIEKVAEHYAAQTVDPIKIEQVEPLRVVERELAEHDASGAPLKMRMGMYQGRMLYPRLRDLYIKTVRDQLVSPLLDIELAKVDRFISKYAPVQGSAEQKEHDEEKERLRMVLLLTGPYAEGEPGLDKEQIEWLSGRIADLWAEPLAMAGDVATRGAMERVARAYVEIVARNPEYLFERNEKRVENVRRILKRTNQLDAMLAELIRDIDVPDLDLRSLTASQVALKNDNRMVRGAYTRQGWENVVRDRLEQPLDQLMGQEWVLGRTKEEAEQSREKLVAELKSLYFDNYIQEWKQFIGAIYVDMPADYVGAQRVFEDLTRGAPPPYGRLAQNLAYHTDLPEASAEEEDGDDLLDQALDAGGKAIEKKGGKAGKALKAGKTAKGALDSRGRTPARNTLLKSTDDVREAFVGLARFGAPPPPPPVAEGQPPPPPPPVPLDTYQEELRRVRDALKAKIDHDGPEETQVLVNAVRSARTAVDGLINETETRGWTNILQKWLPPPFEAVWRLAGESANRDIANQWCNDVVSPMRNLRTRYPFNPQGREVSLSVFAEFFAPEKGTLWAYYNQALAGRIPRRHDTFNVASTGAASRTQVNPAMVPFLNRAHDLSSVVYPTGSDDMLVEFDVWIASNAAVAKTTLTIDGATIEHHNGPERWQRMRWPGDGDKGAELRATNFGVNGVVQQTGNWAFFRMLEEGTVDGASDRDVFIVRWDLRDQGAGIVRIKFRPLEESTPFFGVRGRGTGFMEVFRHSELAPPSTIVVGGPACSAQ